ncbi:MAG: ABC transporter permease subunit [Candidatus Natronoplasma sp.]
MKIGRTMWMELKNTWKAFLLFILVVVLLVGGFAQAYPSFSDAFDEELEGVENVDVELLKEDEGVTVRLSWSEVESAQGYSLLVSKSPNMMTPLDRVENIQNTSYDYFLEYEDGEIPERYFAVVVERGEGERELVGIQTNFDRTTAFQEVWGVDYGDIQGFLSILWSSWWALLIGLYIGYVSVNVVTRDYEEDRMDILLSKPISRRQYLLEKFSVISLYTLFLLTIVGLVLIGSVYSVGELDSVSSLGLMISSLLSWPVFLVMISVSILAAVYLESSRKAVGVSFLFILVQYGINMVGDMSESLENVKPYTIINYWDYEAALYGESIGVFDTAFLLSLTALLVVLASVLFERKDIPV